MAEINGHKKSKLVADAQQQDEAADYDKPADHRTMRLTKSTRKQFNGFMDFVRQQGVVGLAVGLTIGTAVTVFVKSIVDGIVNPVIGALLPGSSDLASKYTCLNVVSGKCTNKLAWGMVLSNFISFLAIALLVYFAVHLLKLDRLDKKKDAPPPVPTSPKK